MKLIIPKHDFEIELEVLNTNLADYWFDQIFKNNLQDKFSIKNTYGLDNTYNTTYIKLINNIQICNKILNNYPEVFPERFQEVQYNDITQEWFNETHRIWAEANIKNFHNVLRIFYDNKNKLAYHNWQEINPCVHFLERGLNGGSRTHVKLNEPYQRTFLSFTEKFSCNEHDLQYNTTNFNLEFGDIGRPQFEQYMNNGKIGIETKNWKRITPNFNIEFSRYNTVIETGPTEEYKDWCNTNNLKVLGPYAGLARFKHNQNYVIAFNRVLSAETDYIKLELKK